MKVLICYIFLSVSSLMISMASALTNHWVIGRSSCHFVSQLVSSVFLSHQISISHQPANSTFLLQQISISYQPQPTEQSESQFLEPQWDQGEAILAYRKGCRNWLADHQSCTRCQKGNFPTAQKYMILCSCFIWKQKKKCWLKFLEIFESQNTQIPIKAIQLE